MDIKYLKISEVSKDLIIFENGLTIKNPEENREITIVTPTGIFDNFRSEFKNTLPGFDVEPDSDKLKYKYKKNFKDEYDHFFLRRKFIDDKRTINFEKKGHRVLVRNILYKHLNKRQEQNNFSLMTDAFSNQIVIFDEVHRLFRINKTTMESYLKQYIENRFLKNSKRYITMTGTPINKSLDDVVEMLDFVQSAGQPRQFYSLIEIFPQRKIFCFVSRIKRLSGLV